MPETMKPNLANLQFLSGSMDAFDLWLQAYDELLRHCQKTGDKATAKVLQQNLIEQSNFLWKHYRKGGGNGVHVRIESQGAVH